MKSSEHASYLEHIRESSLDCPNKKQRDFITRESEDFAILQGPPGTGKSLALGHAVLRQAHEWITDSRTGHALVVAPSHRAVNATLEKVDAYKHAVLREMGCDAFDSLRLVRVLSRDRGYRIPTQTNVEFINYNNSDSDKLDAGPTSE